MSPGEPSSEADPLAELAEEFAERYRRGQRPSLSEYTRRYPHLAERIRKLFPALVVMEEFGSVAGPDTGPYRAAAGGLPPRQLGDYRILREVGRGGMGVVYEAVQESLGRHVALKVLPPGALLNPTFLARFQREAKAAARLHHTNIVPVFGVGESDGVHYYAMQFIQGEPLDRVLRDLRRAAGGTAEGPREGSAAQSLLSGRFSTCGGADGAPPEAPPAGSEPPPGEPRSASLSARGTQAGYYRSVAQVGLQVAEALAYAHRQGILHRDIKPSNLLLDLQGTVWITDFGLAKAEGADELTQTGDIVGTLRYMAPERFDGRSLPHSDVYSLGLTLYELLALRPAFDGATREVLLRQVSSRAPSSLASPKSVIQTVPCVSSSRLDGLMSRCSTPCWWAWASASATCRATRAVAR